MSAARRLARHPILLEPLAPADVPFAFDGRTLAARPGEVITSALQAAGVQVLGRHPHDGGHQGLFCANGQCSQCLVLADGLPVKGCMAVVRPGMSVQSLAGAAPPLAADDSQPAFAEPDLTEVQVLIIGGGPAGVSAALELGRYGFRTLLVDDKATLGGKLGLQTHNFFGSVKDCWAGTRGIDIGHLLAAELRGVQAVEVWLEATAVGVFVDGRVGVVQRGRYRVVRPDLLVVATGARERSLSFAGSDLPGVYGAGAFQTLVNRDRVRAAERLFVLGGGNVGLIGAYHALQAGINVVGLVEALPRCGGYKVHEDKLRRLGVPVWTRHTVIQAHGDTRLEGVTVAAIDDRFQPTPGTERSFSVDTLLLAVGLAPVNELTQEALRFGIPVLSCGDAEEIAEASAAMFSGRITGRRAAERLGKPASLPKRWVDLAEVLKSRPGPLHPPQDAPVAEAVFPILRCLQEIPCNPCSESCPHGLIRMDGGIMAVPRYTGACQGCTRCVTVCPGLAIVLVQQDYDPQRELALVTLPFEFLEGDLPLGATVTLTGAEGEPVGEGRVVSVRASDRQDRRRLVQVEVAWELRLLVAGLRVQEPEEGQRGRWSTGAERPADTEQAAQEGDDPIVCRCERVRRSALVEAIRRGVRDMNELKVVTRAGMGGCGGKTCTDLALRLFREQGVAADAVERPTHRPLVAEVPLGVFAGGHHEGER